MKRNYFIMAVCASLFVIVMAGCGGSKKASKAIMPKEMELALDFEDFRSDRKFFRAVGEGISPDLNVAKKVAVMNAKSEIASSIQTMFDEVASLYTQQYNKNGTPDLGQKFEGMSRTVVSQMLTNVAVQKQKAYKSKKTNDIRYVVGVEMSKEDIGKALIDRVANEMKDDIDFSEEQYRKIFEKALEEYSK